MNIMDAIVDGIGVLIGLVSIVGGLLTAAIAWWGGRMFVRRLRGSLGIVKAWPRVEATVTGTRWATNALGSGAVVGDYIFTDSSGREFVGTDIEPVNHDLFVGRKIDVAYDPANPETSHPTKRIGLRVAIWAALFLALELGLVWCAFTFFRLGLDTIF